jgi:DNA-directed RNA polymerase I subunit RPA1
MAFRLFTQQVVGTSFAFFSEEEVRRLSVKRITNPQTFDTFNRPTEGGVYDKALGPVDFNVVCPTCGLGACVAGRSEGRVPSAPCCG